MPVSQMWETAYLESTLPSAVLLLLPLPAFLTIWIFFLLHHTESESELKEKAVQGAWKILDELGQTK